MAASGENSSGRITNASVQNTMSGRWITGAKIVTSAVVTLLALPARYGFRPAVAADAPAAIGPRTGIKPGSVADVVAVADGDSRIPTTIAEMVALDAPAADGMIVTPVSTVMLAAVVSVADGVTSEAAVVAAVADVVAEADGVRDAPALTDIVAADTPAADGVSSVAAVVAAVADVVSVADGDSSVAAVSDDVADVVSVADGVRSGPAAGARTSACRMVGPATG